jgi:hypothetical protein
MTPSHSHPAALPEEQLVRDCDFTRTRRGGPGGQHRNKVETAVVVRHRPTGIEAEGNERRSQQENRSAAIFRLRLRLALEVRSQRSLEEPSDLWRRRCRGGKIAVNPRHADFPALLAEALDFLAAHDDDLPASAAALGCTASQLIKLTALEPQALLALNSRRSARGQHPLRG